jgi:hypothetical protein
MDQCLMDIVLAVSALDTVREGDEKHGTGRRDSSEERGDKP